MIDAAFDCPKLADLAERIEERMGVPEGIAEAVAIGTLELLWKYARLHRPAGDVGRETNLRLAKQLKWRHDSDWIIQALIETRWLDEHPEHRLVIHDWADNCPDYVHSKLANETLLFATGERPKLTKFRRDERDIIEERYRLRELEPGPAPDGAPQRDNAQTSADERTSAPNLNLNPTSTQPNLNPTQPNPTDQAQARALDEAVGWNITEWVRDESDDDMNPDEFLASFDENQTNFWEQRAKFVERYHPRGFADQETGDITVTAGKLWGWVLDMVEIEFRPRECVAHIVGMLVRWLTMVDVERYQRDGFCWLLPCNSFGLMVADETRFKTKLFPRFWQETIRDSPWLNRQYPLKEVA